MIPRESCEVQQPPQPFPLKRPVVASVLLCAQPAVSVYNSTKRAGADAASRQKRYGFDSIEPRRKRLKEGQLSAKLSCVFHDRFYVRESIVLHEQDRRKREWVTTWRASVKHEASNIPERSVFRWCPYSRITVTSGAVTALACFIFFRIADCATPSTCIQEYHMSRIKPHTLKPAPVLPAAINRLLV